MIKLIRLTMANIIVITGIILNIAAALIITVLVNDNSSVIDDLQRKQFQQDQILGNVWQYFSSTEQSVNTLITLKSLGSDPASYKPYTDLVLGDMFKREGEETSIEDLVQHMTSARKLTAQQIEELYYNKEQLMENLNSLRRKEGLLMNIAVFIQMLGLALILSKEIFKK